MIGSLSERGVILYHKTETYFSRQKEALSLRSIKTDELRSQKLDILEENQYNTGYVVSLQKSGVAFSHNGGVALIKTKAFLSSKKAFFFGQWAIFFLSQKGGANPSTDRKNYTPLTPSAFIPKNVGGFPKGVKLCPPKTRVFLSSKSVRFPRRRSHFPHEIQKREAYFFKTAAVFLAESEAFLSSPCRVEHSYNADTRYGKGAPDLRSCIFILLIVYHTINSIMIPPYFSPQN